MVKTHIVPTNVTLNSTHEMKCTNQYRKLPRQALKALLATSPFYASYNKALLRKIIIIQVLATELIL